MRGAPDDPAVVDRARGDQGDADDKVYISKKILVQKENHLKFRNLENKVIEYRSAGGLNYIIEDM